MIPHWLKCIWIILTSIISIAVAITVIYLSDWWLVPFGSMIGTFPAVTSVNTDWRFQAYNYGVEARRGADGGVMLRNTLSTTYYAVDLKSHSYQLLNAILNKDWDTSPNPVVKCSEPGPQSIPPGILQTQEHKLATRENLPVATAGKTVAQIQQSPSAKKVAVLSATGGVSIVFLEFGGVAEGSYKLQIWDNDTKKFEEQIYDVPRSSRSDHYLCWLPDEKAVLVIDVLDSYVIVVDLSGK